MPREQKPFRLQNVQGLAHPEIVELSLTAAAVGVFKLVAVVLDGCAFAAAARRLSDSLICCKRAFWLSVKGRPVLRDVPPCSTNAANSVLAKVDTRSTASTLMT